MANQLSLLRFTFMLVLLLLLPEQAYSGTGTVWEGGLKYVLYFTGTKYDAVADSAFVTQCSNDFSGFADVQSQISYEYSWTEFMGYDENGYPIYVTHTRTLTAPVLGLEIHSTGVTGVNIPGSVTRFNLGGCTGLTSVAIPGSVTSIEPYAFSGCTGLKEVDIPNSVEYIGLGAFANCKGLESIELPESIRSIDTAYGIIERDATFYGCTGLKSIKVFCSPDLGPLYYNDPGIVFYGCCNLERVEFHCKRIVGGFGFTNDQSPNLREITIGNEVEKIDYRALAFLTNVTSLFIPNSVKAIDFGSCPPNLTRVDISDLAAYIRIDGYHPGSGSNRHLYLNGHVITDLIIPVDTVPATSFRYDQDLITLDTGAARVLERDAFANCPNLKDVTINENVKSISKPYFEWMDEEDGYYWIGIDNAFVNTWIDKLTWNAVDCEFYLYAYCAPNLDTDSIRELTIGENVKKIPFNFLQKTRITTLTIPPSVTAIGSSAFTGCGELKTLNWNAQNCSINTSVKSFSVDPYLTEYITESYGPPFSCCMSLTHINIGSGTQVIEGEMFYIEDHLNIIDTVTCYAAVPPTISADCFTNKTYNNAVLEVPRESLEVYQNAEGWKKFFKCSAIEDIPGGEDNKVRGDVDGDGKVTIGDVTALIDYLLSGDTAGINLDNADCNQDGIVSIADVITLIDYLLTGSW